MVNIKVLTMALSSFLAVSFTLCVVGGVLFPGLPIRHVTLESLLPGFTWISPGAFVLGFVESVLYGVYAGLLFGGLLNLFARRLGPQRETQVSVTKAA